MRNNDYKSRNANIIPFIKGGCQEKISKNPNSREAGTFTKRIGCTVYRVGVYFSETNSETVQEKILRLVKNEVQSGKVVNL